MMVKIPSYSIQRKDMLGQDNLHICKGARYNCKRQIVTVLFIHISIAQRLVTSHTTGVGSQH